MKINTLKNNNKNIDKRGYLFEFLKEKEHQLSFKGQIYFATIRPGFSRGDHYHKHRSEIFSVISGKFEFIIHDLIKNKKKKIILDSKKKIDRIIVKPFQVHLFKNIGKNIGIILCYTDKEYKVGDRDVYKFQLSK
jgi:UDP-2-acetamido-2,6-beta-L-arabino-hexul-4-ose reductase